MSIELALMMGLGYWGDTRWGTGPWLLLAGAGFGFLIASLHLYQMVQAFQKHTTHRK